MSSIFSSLQRTDSCLLSQLGSAPPSPPALVLFDSHKDRSQPESEHFETRRPSVYSRLSPETPSEEFAANIQLGQASPPPTTLMLSINDALSRLFCAGQYYDLEKRNLADWDLNARRLQLILPQMSEDWPESAKYVHIIEPEYSVQVIKTDASASELVQELLKSRLYEEHKIDTQIRLKMARESVFHARQAARDQNCGSNLELPIWRHMLENYMLNLACEAQCLRDYRQALKYCKYNGIPMSISLRKQLWQETQRNVYAQQQLNWEVDPIDCEQEP